MAMAAWPTRPAVAIFTKHPTDASPGLRPGRRVDAALAKTDPATGKARPLLACPFTTLLFGETSDAPPPADGLVLAGEQHVVKPGEGDLLVLMLVRRRAELTHDAFRDRWLHGHAPFGLRTSASGYRQLHPARPPGPDGFDGAGLVFFRDLAHMTSARAAPAITRDATRDEMAFIDHSRSMLAMFRFD
ncbi:hypothetical protein Swit_1020 [Rhizorhabdus wittichii RW1]|uniref:EthD domain-containing protein n=1 Tax=Rhizorhabdus wittichii (strain DSM 6014 / CCUG 31198 / JCM 15750 / NBRC 105917 / EY 4224 / RW1) TaxID=392499 RepID=A0A9J9H9M8_RHIWR|nr:hypothetical protein Swit_1020 [Rhizorhabdus wittichii RW1]